LKDNLATIVCADDDAVMNQLVRELIGPLYHIVETAVDGREALRCILESEPDFAVLDIAMPELDGIAVAKKLRENKSATKIVFLTCIDDEDYVHAARSVGNGYVLKRRLLVDLLPALAEAEDGRFFCSV
jgi:CheY-like chemotaxis protein